MRLGNPELLTMLASAGALLIPVTVLGELEGGFEIGSRARANRHALTEFLSEPFVLILETTAALRPDLRATTPFGPCGPGERYVDRCSGR